MPNFDMDACEDFRQWAAVFSVVLENGGECDMFLQESEKLIDHILKSGALPSAIADFTSEFLTDTVPKVTRSILHFTCLDPQERQSSVVFLKAALKLAVWGFCRGDFQIASLIQEILDDVQCFYSECVKTYVGNQARTGARLGSWYRDIANDFLQDQQLEQMVKCVKGTEPDMMHFQVLLETFYALGSAKISSVFENEFLEVWGPLAEKLRGMMDEKVIRSNVGTLNDVFSRLFDITKWCDDFAEFAGVEDILAFLEFCLKSPIFDIQLLGLTGMSWAAHTNNVPMETSFARFVAEHGVLSYVIEKDINHQVLGHMESIFVLVSRKGMLDLDIIRRAWQKALDAHPNDKKVLCRIVGFSIVELESEVGMRLLSELLNKSALRNSDFLQLMLRRTARKGKSIYFVAIFEFLINHVDDEVARTLLKTYFPCGLIGEAEKNECARILWNSLRDKKDWGIFRDVNNVVAECSTDETVQQILEVLEEHPCDAFDVLATAAISTAHTFDVQAITDIWRVGCRSEGMFGMLSSIMKHNSTWAFQPEALERLGDYLKEMIDESFPMEAISCLATYVVLRNYEAGMLRSGKSYAYQTSQLPEQPLWCQRKVIDFQLLMDVIAKANDKEVRNMSKKYLFSYVSGVPGGCDSMGEIMFTLLEPYLEGSQTDSVIAHILETIFEIITKNEANIVYEDWGYSRLRQPLSLNRLIVSGMNSNHEFHAPLSMTVESFAEQVALYYGVLPQVLEFEFRGEELKESKTLSFYGLTDGDTIRVSIDDIWGIKELVIGCTPLSIRLTNARFQDHCVKYLEYEQSGQLAWKLLKLLPWIEPEDCTWEGLCNLSKYPMKLSLAKVDKLHPSVTKSFCDADGLAIIVDRFLSDDDMAPFLARKLAVIPNNYLQSRVSEIVPRCLDLILTITKKSVLRCIQQIMLNCESIDQARFLEAFANDVDSLVDIIRHGYSFSGFQKWAASISDPVPLVQKLAAALDIDRIDEAENSRIVIMLTVLVPKVKGKCDFTSVVEKCKMLLETGDCDRSAKVIDVMRAIGYWDESLLVDLANKALTSGSSTGLAAAIKYARAMDKSLDDVFLPYVSVPFDEMLYDPAEDMRSESGLVGLRNLGATCYMNSVLQQLFSVVHFTYLLLRSEFTSDEGIELKKLFAWMLLSSKRFLDTRPFASVWRGWQRRPINVAEQQDANEFFQLFVDQLPEEMKQIFQGRVVNTIEGLTTPFKSVNYEDFFSLSMTIQGFSSLEDSMKDFTRDEIFSGDNQVTDDCGAKVDAKKYARIDKAPQVLVVHLKRFEYDFASWERYKVNSLYEFPRDLNLRPIMADDTMDSNYHLRGIVIHEGGAQAGHYMSIIRYGDKWFRFNDREVTLWDPAWLSSETFGGSDSNAYLLFYEREDASFQLGSNNVLYSQVRHTDIHQFIPPELAAEITASNNDSLRRLSVFSQEVYEYMLDSQNAKLLINYLFHVYWHSTRYETVEQFYPVVQWVLESVHAEKELLNFLVENSDYYVDLFLKQKSSEDGQSMASFVNGVLSALPLEERACFVDKVVHGFKFLERKWNLALCLSWFPASFVVEGVRASELALQMNWHAVCAEAICGFYERNKGKDYCIERVDFSNLFLIMQTLVPLSPDPKPYESICPYFDLIVRSEHHFSHFVALFTTAGSLIPIKLDAVMNVSGSTSLLPTFFKDKKLLRQVAEVVAKDGDSVFALASFLESAPIQYDRTLGAALVTNFYDIIFPMLVSRHLLVQSMAARVCDILNHQRANLAKIRAVLFQDGLDYVIDHVSSLASNPKKSNALLVTFCREISKVNRAIPGTFDELEKVCQLMDAINNLGIADNYNLFVCLWPVQHFSPSVIETRYIHLCDLVFGNASTFQSVHDFVLRFGQKFSREIQENAAKNPSVTKLLITTVLSADPTFIPHWATYLEHAARVNTDLREVLVKLYTERSAKGYTCEVCYLAAICFPYLDPTTYPSIIGNSLIWLASAASESKSTSNLLELLTHSLSGASEIDWNSPYLDVDAIIQCVLANANTIEATHVPAFFATLCFTYPAFHDRIMESAEKHLQPFKDGDVAPISAFLQVVLSLVQNADALSSLTKNILTTLGFHGTLECRGVLDAFAASCKRLNTTEGVADLLMSACSCHPSATSHLLRYLTTSGDTDSLIDLVQRSLSRLFEYLEVIDDSSTLIYYLSTVLQEDLPDVKDEAILALSLHDTQVELFQEKCPNLYDQIVS